MAYGFDRMLYPVRVTSANNTIIEGTTPYEVEPDDSYYQRESSPDTDTENTFSGYTPLFDAIDEAISSVSIDVEWFAPPGYEYAESLRFVADDEFSFGFADSNFTFPKQLLGFPADQDTPAFSTQVDSQHIIEGVQSVLGSWIAAPLHSQRASDKRSHIESETYASTDPIYEETEILQMRDERKIRLLSWQWVPGLRVKGGEIRGEQSSYRNVAKVGDLDHEFETDADALGLREMYRRTRQGERIMVYYDAEQSQTSPPVGHTEGVRLADVAAHESSEEWSDMERAGGEFYEVDIPVLVTDGEWRY